MRILYLHQYFQTPRRSSIGIGGTRSYEFGRRFVEAGHDVEVVCSWVGAEKNRMGHWEVTNESGIKVHWLHLSYSNRMGYFRRMIAFMTFALAAISRARRIPADVVYATSTPLTIAIPALAICLLRKLPLVFEVRDLWPEAPRQLGALRNPLIYWLARKLEIYTYRRAVKIIALSPGMKDGILATGETDDKVSVIPNSCDIDVFSPNIDGSAFRRRLGVGDRCVFLYSGTMGVANGLHYVLDTAAELKRRGVADALFVIHGDGKQRPELEERRQKEMLDNVIIGGPSPKIEMPEIIASADVCMTIFADFPILYTCSPNKMFDAFAAGKPVLTNMPGWISEVISKNLCGVCVPPADPKVFADAVEAILRNRADLPEMGRRSRQLAEAEFSRDRLARQALTVLEQAHANVSQSASTTERSGTR